MEERKGQDAFREHVMRMRKPAMRWEDALPSGNGTMGALVYGNIQSETILLNHEEHWEGSVSKELPDLSVYLPELRRLLAEGKYAEANSLYPDKLREAGYYANTGKFQPGFDLIVESAPAHGFREYGREVDFASGQVSVNWIDGDIGYRRKLFVSRTDDVIVLSLGADRPGSVSVNLKLEPHEENEPVPKNVSFPELPYSFDSSAGDGFLVSTGIRDLDGTGFGAVARVIVDGGKCSSGNGRIELLEANEVIVLIRLYAKGESQSAVKQIKQQLLDLPEDYGRLLESHEAVHRELFLRMELDLQPVEGRGLVNEQWLLDAYNGEVPAAFMETMFDYGRYLLLSSSRPGGLPANLQGVWNGDYNPAWASAFFNNENIQMNYWQALQGNMAETLLPFLDFFESLIPDMRKNAQAFYGCRGILAPLFASPDSGLKKNLQPHVVYWSAGAGWLAQHFYDYWLFTGDREFLGNRAVPFLKECALFYEDFFTEGEDGYFISSPSNSPENWADGTFEGALKTAVCINATMDFAVAKEVLVHLCAACRELGIEEGNIPRWEGMLAKIPPYQINEDGALREWMHPDLLDNYHHRHQSHIYPLFPGLEVTEETHPQWFEACRVAVEKRLVIGLKEQTGWSLSHMANIYARLGSGDRALDCLELSSRSCVGDNLWTYHNDWRRQGITMMPGSRRKAPFQIDANMGWTAAMLEMLVFSSPGMIKLLPALPSKWGKGRFRGLLCRSGAEVSMDWDREAGWANVRVASGTDQRVTVKLPWPVAELNSDGEWKESPLGPLYREVSLRKDREFAMDLVFMPQQS